MSRVSTLIYRHHSTKHIDVQTSLQAFAKELIAIKDEETRLRTSRRFRTAITTVLKDAGRSLTQAELVRRAYAKLRVKPEETTKVLRDLRKHVAANLDTGYLRSDGVGVVLKNP